MNYAGRMNSFIFKGGNVLDAIAEYKKMHGLTHLEFNYPEHVEGYDIQELKKAMGDGESPTAIGIAGVITSTSLSIFAFLTI